MAETLFVLGDTLPTYYDVAIAIFSVATKLNSTKMKETIKTYSKSLIDVWEKAFGPSHVLTIKSIMSKIEKLVTNYFNNVYSVFNRKSAKHEVKHFNQSQYGHSTDNGKPLLLSTDVLECFLSPACSTLVLTWRV